MRRLLSLEGDCKCQINGGHFYLQIQLIIDQTVTYDQRVDDKYF